MSLLPLSKLELYQGGGGEVRHRPSMMGKERKWRLCKQYPDLSKTYELPGSPAFLHHCPLCPGNRSHSLQRHLDALFTAALFRTAKTRQQSKCPSIQDKRNQLQTDQESPVPLASLHSDRMCHAGCLRIKDISGLTQCEALSAVILTCW